MLTPRGREVFVRPFPSIDQGVWQVSQAGGTRPLWSRKSLELYYMSQDEKLMQVPVDAGTRLSFGTPRVLFQVVGTPDEAAGRTFDIAPDGRRFLFVRDDPAVARADDVRLSVVLNWASSLSGPRAP